MTNPIPSWVWKPSALLTCALLAAVLWAGRQTYAQDPPCPPVLASSIFTLGARETLHLYVTNVLEPNCPLAESIPATIQLLDMNGAPVAQSAEVVPPGRTVLFTVRYDQVAPNPGEPPPRTPLRLTVRAGQEQLLYMELSTEILKSTRVGGGSGSVPTESVSFNYGKINWTYTQQKTDGSVKGAVLPPWNLEKSRSD